MEAARRSAQQQLCLAYNARLVPNSPLFPWPDARRLLAAQEGLDEALFGDVQGAEATEEYDRAFLKHLVARTERAISNASEDDEAYLGVPRQDWAVNEALLERYVELVSLPQNVTVCGLPVPKAIYMRHYFPVPNAPAHPVFGPCDAVTLREEGVAISMGTTGLKTWEASFRLGAHIVQEQEQWCRDGERIVELGSGAGFLGMLCARLLQQHHTQAELYLTDVAGNVMDRLRETAQITLNWLDVADAASDAAALLREANATRVIAADVVYDPALVGPLTDALRAALLGDGHHTDAKPFALVSSTVRNPTTYQSFLDALHERGMQWHTVDPGTPAWPQQDREPLPLFPSAHDPELGGKVSIVHIQLVAQ